MDLQPNRARLLVAGLLLSTLTPAVGRGQAASDDPASLEALRSLSDKPSLTADELAQARAAMLKVNNEARLNPAYRKQKKLRQDLELPSGLSPLALGDKLNAAAQQQAEEKAGLRQLPRGTTVPGLMASGTSASLADFPVGWQSSESTYRPTWNLGGDPVDSVGFGMAKNARSGTWSVVAIWADLGGAAVKDSGLHDPSNVKQLTALNDKASLTPEELRGLREAMLRLNNEARANPEYRKKSGSKLDVNLPSGLPPLVLDDAASKAAQAQADYQAGLGQMTHDNRNYRDYGERLKAFDLPGGLEACGVSGSLADFPIGWMKSDTHYRPTWDIVDPVRRVGYGVAKSPRTGQWYATAMWLPATAADKSAQATPAAPSPTANAPAPAKPRVLAKEQRPARNYIPDALRTVDGQKPHGVVYYEHGPSTMEAGLNKGGVLARGDKLSSHDGAYRLSVDFAGKLAITDARGNVKWSAGEGGSHVEYQSDGNFCLYDAQKNWKWGTQAHGPRTIDGSIRLTPDGVLQHLDKDGNVAWSSQ